MKYFKRTWRDGCFVICTDVKIESDREYLSKCKILLSTHKYYKVGTYDLLTTYELKEISEEDAMLEIL